MKKAMFIIKSTMRGLFVFLLLLAWKPVALHAATVEDSTDALLSSLVGNQNDASDRLILLAHREITRPLSDEEVTSLNSLIVNRGFLEAGYAAQVLAQCRQNSISQRLPAVVQRFVLEIGKPIGKDEQLYWFTSLSTRFISSACFLRAFDQFNDPAVAESLNAELRKSTKPESRKWLQIALGYTGASVDRAALLDMAYHDPDDSLRIYAIHAYARIGKTDAIPFLIEMANDQTITGWDCVGRTRGLNEAARDEILRLKNMGLFSLKTR